MRPILLETALDAPVYRGKVRDIYDLGDRMLIVATDRVSALDAALPTGIPRKGEVLTRLSAWWFKRMKEVIPNHFIAVLDEQSVEDVPVDVPPELFGRSMIVRKAKRIDVECVARGYLAGSAWKDYRSTGTVGGYPLDAGLREGEKLPENLFTPTTKADEGHDEPMTYSELETTVGDDAANILKLRTLAVYTYAHTVAADRGIIIADTKLEFGYRDEEIIVIDEVLTPESSRFWPIKGYAPGRAQESFDKQPIRDWLASSGWRDGEAPPAIPEEIVAATTQRYLEVYSMLTGEELPE